MGDRSLWDRLQRKVRGWLDEGGEADDGTVAFVAIYVAPVVLALVVLLRR